VSSILYIPPSSLPSFLEEFLRYRLGKARTDHVSFRLTYLAKLHGYSMLHPMSAVFAHYLLTHQYRVFRVNGVEWRLVSVEERRRGSSIMRIYHYKRTSL